MFFLFFFFCRGTVPNIPAPPPPLTPPLIIGCGVHPPTSPTVAARGGGLGYEVHRLCHGRDPLPHPGRRRVDALFAAQQRHRHPQWLVQRLERVGRDVVRRALYPGVRVIGHHHHQHPRAGRHPLRQRQRVPIPKVRLHRHQRASVPHCVHRRPSPRRKPQTLLPEADTALRSHPRVSVLGVRHVHRISVPGSVPLPLSRGAVGVWRTPDGGGAEGEEVALDDGHVTRSVHPGHPRAPGLGRTSLRSVCACHRPRHAALGKEFLRCHPRQLHAVHPMPARRQPEHIHGLAA
mmetsp:Transcript_19385/g.31381  ORF Transcript_19385/g.31381 Transcript_19385/m.31381 type:complete len:291 (+) Transcript_19385:170-1042(+)